MNNPIMYYDPSGHMAFWLLAGIVLGTIGLIGGGAYAGIKSYEAGNRGWDLVGDIAIGTLVGGAAGFAAGALVGAGASILLSGDASATVGMFVNGLKGLAWAYSLGGPVAALRYCMNNIYNALSNSNMLGYFPSNNGFCGPTQSITLEPGTIIQRFGGTGSNFVSPYYTDPMGLSLPYHQMSNMANPTMYVVNQPITVTAGQAAP